jgi:hypothetical protein
MNRRQVLWDRQGFCHVRQGGRTIELENVCLWDYELPPRKRDFSRLRRTPIEARTDEQVPHDRRGSLGF